MKGEERKGKEELIDMLQESLAKSYLERIL